MESALAVVIADIDALTVDYLSDLLERHGYRARIAPSAHAAVQGWVRTYGADVCIVDITLRDGDDVSAISALHEQCPGTKIIVRTADTSPETMRAALAAGASGYVHKSRGPVALLDVISRVVAGEVVVEGSFARAPASDSAGDANLIRDIESLTPRQFECLEMLAEGKGTVAMADELGVTIMTIRSHVQALLGKLGASSRLEAAALVTRYHAIARPNGSPPNSVQPSGV